MAFCLLLEEHANRACGALQMQQSLVCRIMYDTGRDSSILFQVQPAWCCECLMQRKGCLAEKGNFRLISAILNFEEESEKCDPF